MLPFQSHKPVFFMADANRGSGGPEGDDPWERDEYLATRFKIAARHQLAAPSQTANPYGLSERAQEIVERAGKVGNLLILLAPALRPVAARILTLRGSDRENGDLAAHVCRDLDLNTPRP